MVDMIEDLANSELLVDDGSSNDGSYSETSALGDVSSSIEGQDMTQPEITAYNRSADEQSSDEPPHDELAPSEEKHSRPKDPWEPLRTKMRAKESVEARVVKWQHNGLEMEIANNGHSAVKAFMH